MPLQLESVDFDSISFEGSQDSDGTNFFGVKVGIRIPVLTLTEALVQLQRQLGKREPGERRPANATDASPIAADLSPKLVVKNTFVSLDEGSKPRGLVRTTTAPASCRGPVVSDTIPEEDSDEGDGDEEAGHEASLSSCPVMPAPLAHSMTYDGFGYEVADPSTWLPAADQESTAVEAQIMHAATPLAPMPPVPPYMMPPMPIAPPWAYTPSWYTGTDPGITPGLAFQHTLMPELRHFSALSSTVEIPEEKPATKVPVLRRTFSVGSGCMRVTWTVSAETLASDERGPVESPVFDLSFGDAHPHTPFRMRLCPKAAGVEPSAASFNGADGKGIVELTCEAVVTEAVPDVRFRIAIGSGERRQPARGPVSHNFGDASTCGLPKEQAIWDFNTAVDREISAFVVCLEVLPCSGAKAVGVEGPAVATMQVVDQGGAGVVLQGSEDAGGPKVVVRNTFLDVEDASRQPAAMLRTTTAPAQYRLVLGRSGESTDDEEEAQEGQQEGPENAGSRPAQTSLGRTETLDAYAYEASNPLTWLPEAPEGAAPASAVTPPPQPASRAGYSMSSWEPPPLRPQVVHRTFNVETGCMCLEWVVSSRKLMSSDTHPAVSPAFDLSFGETHPSVPFKMLIHPKVVDDKKGGASFKTAGGRGYVELACEEMLPATVPEVVFRIATGTRERRQQFRGPVSHNFSEKKVCGLPKDQALWNFNTVVDKESKTFVICLEVLPSGAGDALASIASSIIAPAAPAPTKRW